MSFDYVGSIPAGSLVRKKWQRPTGGCKNVYHLGMQRSFYDQHAQEIHRTLVGFGGEPTPGYPNNVTFRKKPQALKAWTWFVMRFS